MNCSAAARLQKEGPLPVVHCLGACCMNEYYACMTFQRMIPVQILLTYSSVNSASVHDLGKAAATMAVQPAKQPTF